VKVISSSKALRFSHPFHSHSHSQSISPQLLPALLFKAVTATMAGPAGASGWEPSTNLVSSTTLAKGDTQTLVHSCFRSRYRSHCLQESFQSNSRCCRLLFSPSARFLPHIAIPLVVIPHNPCFAPRALPLSRNQIRPLLLFLLPLTNFPSLDFSTFVFILLPLPLLPLPLPLPLSSSAIGTCMLVFIVTRYPLAGSLGITPRQRCPPGQDRSAIPPWGCLFNWVLCHHVVLTAQHPSFNHLRTHIGVR
jgi:hypothetical protein